MIYEFSSNQQWKVSNKSLTCSFFRLSAALTQRNSSTRPGWELTDSRIRSRVATFSSVSYGRRGGEGEEPEGRGGGGARGARGSEGRGGVCVNALSGPFYQPIAHTVLTRC